MTVQAMTDGASVGREVCLESPPPLGPLHLSSDPLGRVVHLGYEERPAATGAGGLSLRLGAGGAGQPPPAAQLAQYLTGERRQFDLDLWVEATPFQAAVWRALAEIPFGATATYGEIAERVGRPLAVRAVGSACGANPIAIAVPCHRVVGARRRLTGYRGGLARKLWLLQHEGLPEYL